MDEFIPCPECGHSPRTQVPCEPGCNRGEILGEHTHLRCDACRNVGALSRGRQMGEWPTGSMGLVGTPGLQRGALAAPALGVKVGRNEPCPCGSGQKYKKCHGR